MLFPCTKEPDRTPAKPPPVTSLSAIRTALSRTGLFLLPPLLLLVPPSAPPPVRLLLQHLRTFLANVKRRLEAIRDTARGVCQDARRAHPFRNAFTARFSRSTTMTVSAGNMVEMIAQTRLQISFALRTKIVVRCAICPYNVVSSDFLLF